MRVKRVEAGSVNLLLHTRFLLDYTLRFLILSSLVFVSDPIHSIRENLPEPLNIVSRWPGKAEDLSCFPSRYHYPLGPRAPYGVISRKYAVNVGRVVYRTK